jgi:hypothetical protein
MRQPRFKSHFTPPTTRRVLQNPSFATAAYGCVAIVVRMRISERMQQVGGECGEGDPAGISRGREVRVLVGRM